MKMNKIRVAKATVNGKESLIFIVVDPDGRKMCMTMAELDDDGTTDVIVMDDGFIVSKDEVGYEDHEGEFKEMFEKQELGENCISPQLHTLAWQLINKFSLKTRLNSLYCLVMYRCVIQSRSHSILICIFSYRNAFLLIYSVRDKILTNIKLQYYEYNYSRRTDWCI